jgi:AAA+ superfamily predicted ATPase
MARSDLLLTLVKAGRGTPDPRFRSAVEALIAEERAKKHDVLADQLAAAVNGELSRQQSPPSQTWSTVGDLLYEINPERGLDDLTLPPIAVRQCRELIEEQQRAELLRSYGLTPRHRLLLVGPPGNGKTSVAQALAHDLMAPLLMVRYEGLIGSYLGETAARLRKVFDYARQRRCVLFFDEFDTVGKERGDVHETGEIKRVVSTLLLQMDQLPAHVVIVTATNHAELLDRAVWRRFELRLRLPPPGPKEIDAFISRLFAGLKSAEGFKPEAVGKQLRGATYSEVEDLFRNVSRRVVLTGSSAEFREILASCVADWKQRVTASSARTRQNTGSATRAVRSRKG